MGFFSWLCSDCQQSIPAYPYAEKPIERSRVVFVFPDNTTKSGLYDGYGRLTNEETMQTTNIEIFEHIAPFLPEYDGTGSQFVFNNVKYIVSPDGKVNTRIKQFGWSDPNPELSGKTLNQLREDGWFIEGNYERAARLIKVVHQHEYRGQRWSEMKTSDDCPDQGFFY